MFSHINEHNLIKTNVKIILNGEAKELYPLLSKIEEFSLSKLSFKFFWNFRHVSGSSSNNELTCFFKDLISLVAQPDLLSAFLLLQALLSNLHAQETC